MANISYPQLVHNIGVAIKEKAGLESLKYGEMVQAIEDMGSGYPINVNFIVEGENYCSVGVQNGGKVSEPVEPTKQGVFFGGWYDEQNKITFPYSPTTNKSLNGIFISNPVLENGLFLLHCNTTPLIEEVNNLQPLVSGVSVYENGKFDNCIMRSSKIVYESSIFDYTAEDKTLEFWVKIPSNASGTAIGIGGNTPSNDGVVVAFKNSGDYYIYSHGYIINKANALSLDVWHHIAVVFAQKSTRQTQYVEAFLDGVSLQKVNQTIEHSPFNRFYIGSNGDMENGNYLFDEIAITNGVKYTQNFTPNSLPYITE